MSLVEKLTEIKRQKDEYILPENIKAGVTIYNITGTLEGGSSGIKLFDTVEAMQADTTVQIGDLALVYNSMSAGVTETSMFSTVTFPNVVVLPEPCTVSDYFTFTSTGDIYSYVDFWGDLTETNFRVSIYTSSKSYRINYTSEDGITYTRTDGGDTVIELGADILFDSNNSIWYDEIGYFMLIETNYFGGFFEYGEDKSFPYTGLGEFATMQGSTMKTYAGKIDLEKLKLFIPEVSKQYNLPITSFVYFYKNTDTYKLIICEDETMNANTAQVYQSADGKYRLLFGNRTQTMSAAPIHYFDVNITNGDLEVTNHYTRQLDTYVCYYDGNGVYEYYCSLEAADTAPLLFSTDLDILGGHLCGITLNEDGSYGLYPLYATAIGTTYDIEWFGVPSQINATAKDVYKKIFFGTEGTKTGELSVEADELLNDKNAELYGKLMSIYTTNPIVVTPDNVRNVVKKSLKRIPTRVDGTIVLDISQTTQIDYLFSSSKLEEAPMMNTAHITNAEGLFSSSSNLTQIPLYDFSNCTSLDSAFSSCRSITSIPNFNTSRVKDMYHMLSYCNNLEAVPLFDTSNCTCFTSMLANCSKITSVPMFNLSSAEDMPSFVMNCTNLTEFPQLDVSHANYFQNFCYGCTNLITFPKLNMSNVTSNFGFQNMFYNCTNLSNTSLNNIMSMVSEATGYKGTKTLKYIGLTSAQANICKTLSNYSKLTSAGWTTGY